MSCWGDLSVLALHKEKGNLYEVRRIIPLDCFHQNSVPIRGFLFPSGNNCKISHLLFWWQWSSGDKYNCQLPLYADKKNKNNTLTEVLTSPCVIKNFKNANATWSGQKVVNCTCRWIPNFTGFDKMKRRGCDKALNLIQSVNSLESFRKCKVFVLSNSLLC